MFGCFLVVRLICLSVFLAFSRGFSFDRTIYNRALRNRQSATTYRNNAIYLRPLRGWTRNNFWPRKINPMALSYSRTGQRWRNGKRRQDIYDDSGYDWDTFPTMDETPTWPPDYNSWPQAPTQPPLQPLPQVVPSQAHLPVQAPYQVPSQVSTQTGVPFNTSQVWPQTRSPEGPFSTAPAQTWSNRVKARQDAKYKPYLVRAVDMKVRNASRVCSPGPPLGVNPLFRNCLIIGDSISLGYLTTVKSELQGLCQVQHAPFAKGSGAVDSRYGLKCLSMMLRTTAFERTSYDAIVFNFGMHDIDYSKMFPEEFVPLEEYRGNLMKIKEILLQTGAQVAFALTTPVPIAGRRNKRVVAYNEEATRVMEDGRRVETLDLHSAVIHKCGNPPYETCSIMKQPKDVHFNPKGNKLLGVKVAATFRSLLSKAKPRGQFSPPKPPELSAREGLASSYMHDDMSFCPDMVTRCPAQTTCCENLLSLTGYGCCMEPDAVRCPDSWHCCPRGAQCSSDCNFRSCKCVFPLSLPVVSKLQNEENKKEEKESKEELESRPGSHSENNEVKPAKPVKPVKPVKAVQPTKPVKPVEPVESAKQVNDQKVVPKSGRKPSKEHERKDGHKTEKKRKQKSVKKLSGLNTPQKKGNELKDKHHLHKKKKHKEHRKNKEGKMDQKLKSIAKEKHSKNLLNKYVVKSHTTHRKTHYHPTVEQHWVTRFDDGFGIPKKHKPRITFAHTWGKRKHQDLSFKQNGKKNKKFDKDTSLTEELTHLIIKHHRKKFRVRLKVHLHTNAEIGRFVQRKKKTKVKPIQSAESLKLVKHHSFRKKKELASKTVNEVKIFNQRKENPILLKHENLSTKNEFKNSRPTLQKKVIANAKINHGNQRLNPPKNNETIQHFTETSPQNVNSTISTKIPTEKLDRKLNDSSSKNGSTVPSTKQLHRATFTEMSSNVNGKENNTSTSLFENSSFSGSGNHKHDVAYAVDNVSQKAVNNTKSLFHVTGNSSRHSKSQSTYSGTNNKKVSQNQNRLQISAREEHGITSNEEALAKSGVRNLNGSIVNIDDIGFTSADDARIDGNFRGSGFKGSGSASGIIESFSRTGGYDESINGEDAVEQMDNYSSTTDRAVRGSGFEADETSTVFASGFLDTPSFRYNYHDLHIDDGVTKQTENKSGTDEVVSGTVFHSKESPFGSGSGLNAPKTISSDHHDLNNGKHVIKYIDNNTIKDQIDGESGLEANREFPFISGSGFEPLSLPSDNYRDSKKGNGVARTDIGLSGSVFVVDGSLDGFKADEGLSGSGFEPDESSIGSGSGHLGRDNSRSDQLLKNLLLSNEENERLNNHLKEVHSTEELLPKGSLTNAPVGNGSHLASPSSNVIKTSDRIDSGSTIDDVSIDFGSGLQFEGEGDIDEESQAEDSNKDDIQSGLLASSGKKIFNFTSKKEEKAQKVLHQYSTRVSEGSLTDISQVRFSHWNQDVQDDNSGFENGLYESSTQWSSGEYGSSESISGQPPRSPREYTTNSSNFHSNRRSIDGRHVSKNVNVNLQRRNIVPGSMTDNHMYHRKKTRNTNSLRTEPTSKHKMMLNNHHISWKDKELQQLMYWLSANNEKGGSRNYNKKMPSMPDKIAQTDSKSTTRYSQFHNILLKKIFPNFSES